MRQHERACSGTEATAADSSTTEPSTTRQAPSRARARARARKSLIGLLLAAATVAAALLLPAVARADGPQLWTGQADYSPESVVDVHGSGFAPETTYAVPVKRPDGSIVVVNPNTHLPTPGWELTTTDAMGNLNYDYQLDGIIGLYEARAYPVDWQLGAGEGWNATPIASATFTDGPIPSGGVSLTTWKTQPPNQADWINGTLNANNSDYKEGETVPFRLELGTLATSGNPYTAPICRDYQLGSGVFGYTTLQPFNTSRAAAAGGTIGSTSGPFSGVNITITNVNEVGGSAAGGFDCGSTQRLTIVTFNVSASGPQYLLWGGRLASPADPGVGDGQSASFWTGGSLQMRLASPDKTSGIQPGAVTTLAQITVTKIVDSGSAAPSTWCFNISPNPTGETLPKCPAADGNSVTFEGLGGASGVPTNYTITETTVAGYAFASGNGTNCTFNGDTATATVTANQGSAPVNASCTFHNAIQPAHLVVCKHVVNDNGGTATAGHFTLDSGGANDSPDNFAGVEPAAGGCSAGGGTNVTLDAGSYAVTETGPSGYTRSDSADCSGTIAAGQTKYCTVTNNDQAAQLIVIKHVINDNGGSATAANFTLDSGGAGDSPDNFAGQESPGTTVTLDAGNYNVSETGPSGYTASYSADCSGAIAIGQTKTCTVTNDDQAAKLIVIKHVINDNGGSAVAADFTLDSGGAGDSPDNFAGEESPGTQVTLDAGSYNVSETGPSGYTASYSANCSGAIANGQTKTCTVTNDDQAAKLIVIKHVINDNGGTATAANFTLDSGGAGDSPDNFAGQESPGTTVTLDAGNYNVTESGPSGYSASYSADCSGAIANGQTKTCTVTNDDQAAKLIVIKHVINDNGGSASAADFTLDSGGANDTPDNFAGEESPGTQVTLDAGNYNVTESGPSGYTASNSADCSGSIANGQTKTCTVTNDDQAAKLIVIKHVINDNGGSAVAANFTLDSGGAGDSPDNFAGQESPGTTVTLDAGNYNVTESGPSGYTASFSADCSGSIANGQTKTCTVTNDDQAAKLIVIKHVINDNGGTATAANFTLDSGGANDTPDNFAGEESPGTQVTLDAGSYSVTESGPSGYSASFSADCAGSIANGQTKTCTVTNDDQAAKLIVIKHVINDNGGTATAANFTLDSGGANDTPDNFAGEESPGTQVTLDAGSYNVTETGPSGYTASYSADCSGSIANGQTKTCTVTNDDQAAKLIVIKHVINDNGGTATAANFTLDSGGAGDSPDNFAGEEAPGTQVTLDAGSYNVTESGPSGYAASYSSYCSGSIANGQTKTCTVTNDDQAAHLIVIKHVINNNGGTATAATFTMSVTGSSPSPGSFAGAESPGTNVTINAGSYSVSETGPSGYAASFSADCTGSLALGQTKTCTVTNDDIQPQLVVIKHVINDNGGTKVAANFTMHVTGSSPSPSNFSGAESPGTTVAINAGNYNVTEDAVYGYTGSSSADCSGSIAVGQTKTCTITNDDKPGTIVVTKLIKPTGSQTSFSFQTNPDPPYAAFSLTAGNSNSQTLNAGSYTVKELVPLGWVLTGIGGSSDPNTPYNCTVQGSGGSTGVGDLNTQTATINLKNGDTVTCVFENTGTGVTRTQGFWATHPQLAQIAWFGGTAFGHTFPGVAATAGIGDRLICGRPIDTLGKLMGGFWASISKKSNGDKRSSLDQSRMQLLQQLLAAELNASAFGSVPSGGTAAFGQWESALCGTNNGNINNAQGQAASFNSNGDSGQFTPGTSADSKGARDVADIPFWNTIS